MSHQYVECTLDVLAVLSKAKGISTIAVVLTLLVYVSCGYDAF